jgi:chitodextrinase
LGRGRDRLVMRQRLVLAVLSSLIAFALLAVPARADPVIAAAGDIACASSKVGSDTCHHKATSDLLVDAGLSKVLALGDSQYDSGALSDFQAYYEPTWGRVKSITAPSLGNHEPGSASGYFDYFGRSGSRTTPPGKPSEGWYSFDVGSWHLIALNSKCDTVGCAAGSAQEQWLRSDLAAHTNTCKLAYWHHPRFSSGHDHDNTFMQDLWQALYDGGVSLALTGHSHDYERFFPMDGNGNRDNTKGITQLVVGTGGAFFTGISTARANSAVRNSSTYGVLKLTLHSTSYDWQFVPESGSTFTDSGTAACVGGSAPPTDTQAPTAPTNLQATASGLMRVDLSWNASSDNVGVTGYEVYRGGTLVATTTIPGYTDSSVAAGGTYTYQVKARDAAGNRSALSNSKTVTMPGTTLKLPPLADAMVQQANPSTNYGTATYLRADGGSDPDVAAYFRFSVTGISGTVESAKLRAYAQTGTGDGTSVQSTTSGWAETELNWNSKPAPTSGPADDKGTIAAGTWVEYDVKPFVTGSGSYGFILAPTSSDGVDFASREAADATRRPQLVLSVTDRLADNGQPPNTTITSAPTGTVNSPSASFEFASTEPSSFECRLDSSGWTGCTSPKTYNGVGKGSHTFRVRATDRFGNTDSTEATAGWSVAYLPSASFDFSPSAPVAGEPVTFTSSSTVVGTDTITKNDWDLDGNGSFETNTGTSPVVSHTYSSAGTFAVKLRVTDTDGDTSTATQNVTVTAPPPPAPLTAPPAPPAALPGLGDGDRKPPSLTLNGPKSQRLRGRELAVLAQCDEPCTATATASVSIGRASREFRARTVTSSVPAAVQQKLRLRFSPKTVRSLRRSLALGRRLVAKVRVTARDGAGNTSSAALKVRLRR